MAVAENEKKRTWLAYVYYLLAGWTGLHHFYIGRDFNAFLWGTTFGGFGLGLLTDLFRLPDLIADANEEDLQMKQLRLEMEHRKKPAWKLERLFYLLATGTLYDLIFSSCLPSEWKDEWYYFRLVHAIVSSLSASFGLWVAGNVGRQRVDFHYPFFGCLLTHAMMWWCREYPFSVWVAFGGMISTHHNREFRRFGPVQRRRRRRSLCRRMTVLGLGGLLITSGLVGCILINGEVTSEDGQPVKIRDALKNFFGSPAWLQMRAALKQLWEELTKDGWSGFFSKLKDLTDVDGEDRSLQALGLSRDATDADIKAAHRRLARKWHPDRNKGNEEEAAEKFMEIQKAYEVLTKLKSLRKGRSNSGDTASSEKPDSYSKHSFHPDLWDRTKISPSLYILQFTWSTIS